MYKKIFFFVISAQFTTGSGYKKKKEFLLSSYLDKLLRELNLQYYYFINLFHVLENV